MFLATQEACDRAGLAGYEISNHARPGAESRHNLVYWRYGDYAGIGPGAHGRLTADGGRWATEALRSPEAWLAAVEAGEDPATRTPVAPEEQAVEMLMMGLRLREGIDPSRYAALAGTSLPPAALQELTDLGLIEQRAGRLRATDAGRPVLDAVLRRLVS
jgi:oxygen-independent coproporphyrinogen-3 oxidase